jgi:hypothetical protein
VFDPIRRLQRSTTLALALSPVGVILIAAARLLIVSDYNMSTATAIVASDGYVNTLLGSLIPVVPLFIPYLGLLLLLSRRLIVGVLALGVAVLVSPAVYTGGAALRIMQSDLRQVWHWSLSNGYVFVLAAGAAAGLLVIMLFGVSAFSRTLGTILAVALIPLALQLYPLPVGPTYYAQLLKQPWLPEERIALASRPSVLGYVLADSNVSMEVLLQTGRSVAFYPNRLIAGEQVCEAAASSLRPLVPLMPLGQPALSCEPQSRATVPGEGSRMTLTAAGKVR